MGLFLLSCLVLGLSAQLAHSDAGEDGVLVGADLDAINRDGLALVQRTQHSQPGELQRLLPGLATFSCPGSISSVKFIADSTASLESSVTISLWEMVNTSGRALQVHLKDERILNQDNIELISQLSSDTDITLYRATFSPPLEFTGGEVLGIGQADSGIAVQYAYGQGPENFVLSTVDSPDPGNSLFISSAIAVYDLPLLALDEYKCSENCGTTTCVDGLLSGPMDLEPFLNVNTNPKIVAPFLGSPNVSPLLRFTTDGTITRWSASGQLESDQLPKLEVWRAVGTGQEMVYQMVGGATTGATEDKVSDTKVFFTQEISFREGDVLGVRYGGRERVALGDILLSPDSYTASGYNPGDSDFKIGAIEISLSIDLDVVDDASEGVESVAEPVVTNTPLYTDTHSDSEFSVFPQFSVPTSGLLRGWVLAAQLTPSLTPQGSIQLQIWRETENALMETFRLIHTTNVTVRQGGLTRGGRLGMWVINLEQPVPVEAGDILGFQQQSSELHLAQDTLSKTQVLELTLLHTDPFVLTRSGGDGSESAVPLMAAEIAPGVAPSTSPTATQSLTTEDDKLLFSLSRDNLIITASVSGALILIGAVLVAAILIYCCRKFRVKKNKELRYRSSLYYTAQKPPSQSSFSSNVYLRSHTPASEYEYSGNGHNEPVTSTLTFY